MLMTLAIGFIAKAAQASMICLRSASIRPASIGFLGFVSRDVCHAKLYRLVWKCRFLIAPHLKGAPESVHGDVGATHVRTR
jgi:hypothetical protein